MQVSCADPALDDSVELARRLDRLALSNAPPSRSRDSPHVTPSAQSSQSASAVGDTGEGAAEPAGVAEERIELQVLESGVPHGFLNLIQVDASCNAAALRVLQTCRRALRLPD